MRGRKGGAWRRGGRLHCGEASPASVCNGKTLVHLWGSGGVGGGGGIREKREAMQGKGRRKSGLASEPWLCCPGFAADPVLFFFFSFSRPARSTHLIDDVTAPRHLCQQRHELGVVALAQQTCSNRSVGVDGQPTAQRVELPQQAVAALDLALREVEQRRGPVVLKGASVRCAARHAGASRISLRATYRP